MRRILPIVVLSCCFTMAAPTRSEAAPISFFTSASVGATFDGGFGAIFTGSQALTDSSWSLIGGGTYAPTPDRRGVASWNLTNTVTPFSLTDFALASVVTTVPFSGPALSGQIFGAGTTTFVLTDPMTFVYDAFVFESSDTPILSFTSVLFSGTSGVLSSLISFPGGIGPSAHLEGVLEPGSYVISTQFNGQTLSLNASNGYRFDLSLAPVPVPEPTSILLLATGCIGLANRARQRLKRSVGTRCEHSIFVHVERSKRSDHKRPLL